MLNQDKMAERMWRLGVWTRDVGALNASTLRPPIRAALNGPENMFEVDWMLVSAGPKRSVVIADISRSNYTAFLKDEDYYNCLRDGSLISYDPSNGTVSEGFLMRFNNNRGNVD